MGEASSMTNFLASHIFSGKDIIFGSLLAEWGVGKEIMVPTGAIRHAMDERRGEERREKQLSHVFGRSICMFLKGRSNGTRTQKGYAINSFHSFLPDREEGEEEEEQEERKKRK